MWYETEQGSADTLLQADDIGLRLLHLGVHQIGYPASEFHSGHLYRLDAEQTMIDASQP